MLRVTDPLGTDYLTAATDLLQRCRLADPTAGIWEAADLQWWSTRDPHDDVGRARFWYDGATPVAAAVVTRWRADRYGADVLGDMSLPQPWAWLADRLAEPDLAEAAVELAVVADDDVAMRRARGLGLVEAAATYDSCWRSGPAERPAQAPESYRLVSRAEVSETPHWLAGRNGERVAERLGCCSLYDPACDLAVVSDDGEVAGYALFWPDPVTGVGLVEPVRVEQAHQGRGLASYLVRSGVARLHDRGCRRMKVSVEADNAAARRAYLGAGFVPARTELTMTRPARVG